MSKSKEELDKLKKDWLEDPIWDIEDSSGFAEHHDELLIFRLRTELRQAREVLAEHERFRITLRAFLGDTK